VERRVPSSPVTILSSEVLSDDWARLTKYRFERTHRDGSRQVHIHQAYDRGNGVAILPYDPARGTVLLVRQFRLPVYLNPGDKHRDGMLIEACAGLLDEGDAEAGIRREAEEELGYRFKSVVQVFDAYMSPGSVTERIAGFVAAYSPADRISEGGGSAHEGEDIETIEMPIDEALAMVKSGAIADGKTIMLIQHVKLMGLAG
jgi:nudix-type nucleoside diphosphatase (YffH/AdpP family)